MTTEPLRREDDERPAPSQNSSSEAADKAASGDTKERLLDAAERLFAEHGFQGASMRAVTQRAGAAVSAANYHFGSKEELVGAVIRRRVQPINDMRIARLHEIEAAATKPEVEAIIDAFFRPLFEARSKRLEEGHGEYFHQVAARLFADPKPLVDALRRELFTEVNDRFLVALRRALPDVPPDEVQLAVQLTVGMMVHVINGRVTEEDAAKWAGDGLDFEPVLERMVVYASAGIRASVAKGRHDGAENAEENGGAQ